MFPKLSKMALRSAKRPWQVLPGPLFPVVKEPERESDHQPQTVAKLEICVTNFKFPQMSSNWVHS